MKKIDIISMLRIENNIVQNNIDVGREHICRQFDNIVANICSCNKYNNTRNDICSMINILDNINRQKDFSQILTCIIDEVEK